MEELEKTKAKGAHRLRSVLLFILKITLASAIIAWIIVPQKNAFLDAIKDFNAIWLVPVIMIYTMHLFVGAWRWRLLLKVQGIDIPFFSSFSMIMKGLFFSLVIPGGALGGDIARASLVASKAPKGTRFEGTFSILMDRFIGMIALFSLALIVISFSIPVLLEAKGIMQLIVCALSLGCMSGLLAAIFIFYIHKLEKIKIIEFVIKMADKYSKGMVSRLTTALDAYRASFKTVLFTIIVSIFFIHLAMCAIVFCISQGLTTEHVPVKPVIMAVTFGNTAGMIPVTQSGLGTRELVMVGVLKMGGFNEGVATAATFIYTAVILSFNLIGGLFFIFASNAEKGFSARKEDGSETV